MAEETHTPESPAAVLAGVRRLKRVEDDAARRQLVMAVSWAAMHSVDSISAAATMQVEGYGDTGLPVAGPGAPLVAEFSVAEFAAAVGMTTDAGRTYLGEAVELRYRLPRVWARVTAGDLPAWKARRIARSTIVLSREAVGFVDAQVWHVAHKISAYALDRLVEAAIARFMPETAEERRRAAADGRHFDVDTRDTSLGGTAHVTGKLDVADALDLDAAVAAGAEQLKALGSTDSLDVRRAAAVGEMARAQQTLEFVTAPEEPARKPRHIVLYAHLSDTAITNSHLGDLGRLENTRSLITAEQVRRWCGDPDTRIVVKPVIDLNAHVRVDQYEVPDRMAEAAVLVDGSCVFPFCTRPARGCRPDTRDADCDHVTPYDPLRPDAGPTCSCNIAPLCRRHHRLKTHGGWRYRQVERGTYLWTSPHGLSFIRDHDGTTDVTRDRPTPACTHLPDR